MITKQVIESIYKKYKKRPKSIDSLNIGLLFSPELENRKLHIDDTTLVIDSLPPTSPFHEIPLERVHAILDFEKHVAVVLHSSIIFIHKDSDKIDVHVNLKGPSFMDKLRMSLSGN